MSCRETSAGSALVRIAQLSGRRHSPLMNDQVCISLFHQLRSSNRNGETHEYTVERYRQQLTHHLETYVTRNYDRLSDARRESLRLRLEDAIANPPLDANGNLDQGLAHAICHVESHASYIGRMMRNSVQSLAARTGRSESEVEAELQRLAGEAPRRDRSLLDGFDDATLRFVDESVRTREMGLRYAFATMMGNQVARERAQLEERPRRIPQLTQLVGENRNTGTPGVEIDAYGYDERTGHLEVRDSDGNVHMYRNVYASLVTDSVAHGGFGRRWAESIRGNRSYQYADSQDALFGAAARRCGACGQYADIHHHCPDHLATINHVRNWTTTSRWSRQTVSVDGVENRVSLPAIREFRQLVDNGPTGVSVSEYVNDGTSRRPVSGELTAWRDENGRLTVVADGLRCSCPENQLSGTCQHVGMIAEAARVRLDPPSRRPRSPEDRAALLAERQRLAEESLRSDWTRNEETLAEAQQTWQRDGEVLYSENLAAFITDYEDVMATWNKDGETQKVPYVKENAMDGLATRGSGQGFGMEIEFDLPPENRWAARNAIARELYEAGITWSPSQQRYHASKQRGFQDTHADSNGVGNWTFESDCSVSGGEIVTPVMYDEPETWEKMEKVCEILARHGAIASKRTGMHVHVGTGNYAGSVEKYAELGRIVTQHEDVLFRAATNPMRGTFRGYHYASPNRAVPETVDSIQGMRMWQNGRYRALNLDAVSGGGGDHPEFRLFDASLDPGTMQAHAKIAVALVAAAERAAETGGTKRPKEELGAHRKRIGSRRREPNTEELIAETTTTRSLLDTLFRRRSDKRQFLAVFAKNKWAKPSGR